MNYRGGEDVSWDLSQHPFGMTVEPLPYSTSIAAAWDVVEKIVQEYRWCDLTFNGTAWECQIDLEKCIAPTAPAAICLAALKAWESTHDHSKSLPV